MPRAEQLHEEFMRLVSGGAAADDVSRAAKVAAATTHTPAHRETGQPASKQASKQASEPGRMPGRPCINTLRYAQWATHHIEDLEAN